MKNKEIYPVVNAHNEWDPLEEIIVGVVEGARISSLGDFTALRWASEEEVNSNPTFDTV